MRMIAIVGSKTVSGQEAKAVALEASRAFRARQAARPVRSRSIDVPDRPSVEEAMLRVERRLVDAIWTLRRLPDRGVRLNHKHGLSYILERHEIFANAVTNGGWEKNPPPPAPPDSRSIDAMDEPLDWFRHLDRRTAQVLFAGAEFKRGYLHGNISWIRVRQRLPAGFETYSTRTLQRLYRDGLRQLAAQVRT